MSAWGIRTFENDDASDWIADFAEKPEEARLVAAIAPVEAAMGDSDAYLEAPDACVALAAAEVVAAWCGRPAPELPPPVTAWLLGRTEAVTGPILDRARKVVDEVLLRGELKDLWTESNEVEAWRGAIEDLRRRLGFE